MAKHQPFPQLVRDGRWIIDPSSDPANGYTVIPDPDGNYRMMVPTADDHMAEIIRRHELAHAKFTPDLAERPAKEKRLDPLAVNAAENYRIARLSAQGYGLMTSCCMPEQCAICDFHVAEYVQNFAGHLKFTGHKNHAVVAQIVGDIMFHQLALPTEILRAARSRPAIDRRLRSSIINSPSHPMFRLVLAQAIHDLIHPPAPKKRKGKHEATPGERGTGASRGWARMDIATPRLTKTTRARLRMSRRRSEVGTAAGDLTRLLTDRQVFSETRRVPGISILIDASGSMCINPDQIASILNMHPASVIACYNGVHTGRLHILAANKRHADPQTIHSAAKWAGGNTCDGPALAWLAKQPGPRIWVCDACITGVDDCVPTKAMFDECRKIIQSAGIIRVHNLEAIETPADLARVIRLGRKPDEYFEQVAANYSPRT